MLMRRPGAQGWLATALALMIVLGTAGTGVCGQVFDRIRKAGKVRLGVCYNRMPFGFLNQKGEWVGFEVDLANEMITRWRLEPELVKITDKNWGHLLAQGKIDGAFCRIRHTRSLESAFDFSVPYFFDSPYVMITKGQFKALTELKGHKIAAVQGSTTEREAMRILREAGDDAAETNVASYPDRPACFLALGRDKVAAWVDSGMYLLEYVSRKPGRFELLRASQAVEEVAAALPQDDSAWRDLVNLTLQDMAGDGSLYRLYNKWFGPDTAYLFPLGRDFEIWPD